MECMEQLARELARLAWELQRDARDLQRWANESVGATGPADSVGESLDRIEQRVGAIHEHTGELVRRVPADLGAVLTELKQAVLDRLREATRSAESAQSDESADPSRPGRTGPSNQSSQSLEAAARLLTPQERAVFQSCFQSGFLSYGEIASRLEITPTSAKNLVNRIFLSDRKRPLFAKQYKHGAVRVGIGPDVEKRILTGSKSGKTDRRRASASW